jgi:hypothetical protein
LLSSLVELVKTERLEAGRLRGVRCRLPVDRDDLL